MIKKTGVFVVIIIFLLLTVASVTVKGDADDENNPNVTSMGARIKGKVTDCLKETPLQGVKVEIKRSMGGVITYDAYTDNNGDYEIYINIFCLNTDYWVGMSKEGYIGRSSLVNLTKYQTVNRCLLEDGIGRIYGDIKNKKGEYISDVVVTLEKVNSNGEWQAIKEENSNSNGFFEFCNLDYIEPHTYRVTIEKEGYWYPNSNTKQLHLYWYPDPRGNLRGYNYEYELHFLAYNKDDSDAKIKTRLYRLPLILKIMQNSKIFQDILKI